MSLGKKIATLIKATLRGGLAPPRRHPRPPTDNPQARLETLRQNLAEIEAKERQAADLLQAARTKAAAAIERDNQAEVQAQQRLILELETHLKNQSTQAVALSEKLKRMENAPAEPSPTSAADPADETAAAGDDSDLTARKSRLSG